MSRKRKSPITQESVTLLFGYQTIDEGHSERQESFLEGPTHPTATLKKPDTVVEVRERQESLHEIPGVRAETLSSCDTSLGVDLNSASLANYPLSGSPAKKPDRVLIEVQDQSQESFYEDPGVRAETLSSCDASVGVDLNSAYLTKQPNTVIEVHESQENLHTSPSIREEAPSLYSASSTSAETDVSPASHANLLATHPEVHESQENFHTSLNIREKVPRLHSASSTSAETDVNPALDSNKLATNLEVYNSQENFHTSPSIREKVPSFYLAFSTSAETDVSPASHANKLATNLKVHVSQENFHTSPSIREEAHNLHSVSSTSAETDVSPALDSNKLATHPEAHENQENFHISPSRREEAPSLYSASSTSAETDVSPAPHANLLATHLEVYESQENFHTIPSIREDAPSLCSASSTSAETDVSPALDSYKLATYLEVHERQEQFHTSPSIREKVPSLYSASSTLAATDVSPAPHANLLATHLEVYESQEQFHTSPIMREKVPSFYPVSTSSVGMEISSAPSSNKLSPHLEARERQENFHESICIRNDAPSSNSTSFASPEKGFSSTVSGEELGTQIDVTGKLNIHERPRLTTQAPSSSSASIASSEKGFSSPLSGEKSDTQIDVIDKLNFDETLRIRTEAPSLSSASITSPERGFSSALSGEESGTQIDVTDKLNIHERPRVTTEASIASPEKGFSSALSREKSDAQIDVTDKLNFHESLRVRTEAASFFGTSNTLPITKRGTSHRKKSDSELVVGGLYCEGGQPVRALRRGSLILINPEEKCGTGDSGAPTFYPFTEDKPDGIISDVQSIMSRQRSASLASLEYYRTEDTTLQVSPPDGVPGAEGGRPPPRDRHYQQSRRLPFWLWLVIAKSLGIKLHAQDKPILATLLYTLTFASALGYILSNWWFMGYDMASDHTKTTVIDATVSMFYTLLWGALGLYANKLAFKLFSHKKFVDMLRLHSKTVLKMNASVVLFSLMLLIVIFNNISAYPNYRAKVCQSVGVEAEVCQARYVFRVIYSFFSVLWNYLVAFVLVSTCRTHVIGIRRFMKALEKDARLYESRFMGQTQPFLADRPILEEYTWVDEDYLEELSEHSPGYESEPGPSVPPRRERDSRERDGSEQEAPTPSSPSRGPATLRHTASTHSLPSEAAPPTRKFSTISYCCPPLTEVPTGKTPGMMSNAEILFRFWKIQSRLRMSSMAMQRWMMSIIALVVMWLAMNLIIWLTYNPSLIDLANFFLPLTLLPLLASAYAEVNQEGQRLLKFICPLEERLNMIYVLQSSPLQMTVYGFSLTYSTITTAAVGILLAFASKVLIQEISGDFNTLRSAR